MSASQTALQSAAFTLERPVPNSEDMFAYRKILVVIKHFKADMFTVQNLSLFNLYMNFRINLFLL